MINIKAASGTDLSHPTPNPNIKKGPKLTLRIENKLALRAAVGDDSVIGQCLHWATESLGTILFGDAKLIKELAQGQAVTFQPTKQVIPAANIKSLSGWCPGDVDA
jgi:hypothetical protein